MVIYNVFSHFWGVLFFLNFHYRREYLIMLYRVILQTYTCCELVLYSIIFCLMWYIAPFHFIPFSIIMILFYFCFSILFVWIYIYFKFPSFTFLHIYFHILYYGFRVFFLFHFFCFCCVSLFLFQFSSFYLFSILTLLEKSAALMTPFDVRGGL